MFTLLLAVDAQAEALFKEVRWSEQAEAREAKREAALAAREAAFDAEIDREVGTAVLGT